MTCAPLRWGLGANNPVVGNDIKNVVDWTPSHALHVRERASGARLVSAPTSIGFSAASVTLVGGGVGLAGLAGMRAKVAATSSSRVLALSSRFFRFLAVRTVLVMSLARW